MSDTAGEVPLVRAFVLQGKDADALRNPLAIGQKRTVAMQQHTAGQHATRTNCKGLIITLKRMVCQQVHVFTGTIVSHETPFKLRSSGDVAGKE